MINLEVLFTNAAQKHNLRLRDKQLRKGEVLLHQGDVCEGIYFIRDGLVRSSIPEPNGKEVPIAFSGPGETIGELEYLTNTLVQCEVLVLKQGMGLFADHVVMDNLINTVPLLGLELARLIAMRLVSSSARMANSLSHSLEYNLLKILLGQLDNLIPRNKREISKKEDFALCRTPVAGSVEKHELASWLGATERHVSRLLLSLGKMGIVQSEKGIVALVNRDSALQRMETLEE